MSMELDRLTISVRPGALAAAAGFVRLFHPAEVGGVMVGYRTDGGIAVVELLPVPTTFEMAGFHRSHERASVALDAYLQVSDGDGHLGYVGEWHSHPSIHSASDQDLASLSSLASRSDALVGMIVIGADRSSIFPFGYLCDTLGVPWRAGFRRLPIDGFVS